MKTILIIILSLPFFVYSQSAFIIGDEYLCDNEGTDEILVSFSGMPPFSFVYSIDGNIKPSITTAQNLYSIVTKTGGLYELISMSDATSSGTISGSARLTVLNSPSAVIFTIFDTLKSIDPTIQFTSNSVGNNLQQEWDFGDNTPTQIVNNPIYTFPLDVNGFGVVSDYQVSLIVTDENSCKDTTFKNISVIDDYWIYIPNSFSPDNNQLNDKFCIEFSAIRESTFTFSVINRHGEVIYKTTNPNSLLCSTNSGWTGKNLEGNDVPPGSYVYEMYYQEWDGWKNTKRGTISLVR